MNPSNSAPEIPGSGMRPLDPISFVLRRAKGVIIVGLILAVLLSPLALITRQPYYMAGGSLLLSPNVKQFLSRQDRIIHGDFRNFARTHASRILSTVVVQDALESLDPEQLPVTLRGLPREAQVNILRTQINAEPIEHSYLLFLSLTTPAPEGNAETINALMAAYIRKLESEQEAQSERRLDFLEGERKSILAELDELRLKRRDIAQELQSTSFNETKNPYFEAMILLQEQYLLAKARELEVGSEIHLAERNQEVIGKLNLDIFAEESVARNEAVYMIDNWTYQKLQELRSSIDGMTADNPDRIYVEERMKAMTQYLENFKVEMFDEFQRILTEKRDFELNQEAVSARVEQEAAEVNSDNLAGALKEAEDIFKRSTELITEGQEVNDDIRLLRDRLALVDDSVRDVSLDAKAPVHVSVEEVAVPPSEPTSDNLGKFLGMIIVAAFGIAGAGSVLLELLDTRIRGRKDLEAALGRPAPDPVPQLSPAIRHWNRLEVAKHHSSKAALAIRKLAVRLNQESSEGAADIYLFTGTSEHTGTSGLARNMVAALSKFRERVLYLQLAESDPEDGETSILQDSVIQPDLAASEAVERVQWNGNLGQLYLDQSDEVLRNRHALAKLLGLIGNNVSAIVVDSKPLVNCDVTQFLVRKVTVNILVSRDRFTRYSELRKAVEHLYLSECNAFTAVLTGLAPSTFERLNRWKEDQFRRLQQIRWWKRYGADEVVDLEPELSPNASVLSPRSHESE
ncbi:MAG: hypothetical protein AAF357_00615 [Verrucomicrobiota bacterium]